MKKWLISLGLALTLAATAHADDWKVAGTMSLPGNGGWDYMTMDTATHRLFVTRGTQVQIVDVDSGELVDTVPDTAGVHGVALVPALGRGFTSDGQSNTVTIFDLASLKPMQQVAVGNKPDGIIYDPASQRVFAMDGKSDDATAIDARTGQVAGRIPLGGQPEYAQADGHGHVYVNLEDKSEVVELDSVALKVTGTWSIAPGESPSGMAIDPQHHKLFIGCHNQMMVIFDTHSHQVAATVPIGQHVDATAFDAGLDEAFSSNGDGTLTVVDARHDKVVQTVQTRSGARTMALDPVNDKIYLCTATPVPGQRRAYQNGSFVILTVSR